jgi:predicted nucleic acid-binding protein
LPRGAAVAFGAREARLAADIYRQLGRPRQRSIDIAVAACALTQDAALWTLNPRDFKDIPGLQLV